MKLKHAAAFAAAVTLALATPAFGAPTNIEVGGDGASGTHPITAGSTGSVSWGMEKQDGSFLRMSCTSAAVPASAGSIVTSGNGIDPVMRFDDVKFVTCTAPGGNLTTITEGPWLVRRQSGTVTDGATDVWIGRVTNVRFATGYLVCKFKVAGQASVTFNEATQVLNIIKNGAQAGGLKMSGIQGCGGQLKEGGIFELSAKLKITSPDGPINAVP